MRHAFVTTELWPLTGGGAGRLNADLSGMLVAAGHDVQVVLVTAHDLRTDDPTIHIVHPTDSAGWDIGFMAASKAAAEGLADLNRESPFDRIEVQDFDGLGFWLLTHRRDLGLDDVPITVRLHGPVDLQIEAMGVETPELAVAAQMEREVFSMADAIVAPSEGIRALAVERYALDPERVLVGTPVVRRLPVVAPDRSLRPRFTVVGRLSEVKGSHDMVAASIPVLRNFPDAVVTFVGEDGWSATADMPMRAWLTGLIPVDVADRIVFLGPADDEELARIISHSTAVVAPSRFESFNLAVHEARRSGTAVVAPDIPAFASMLGDSVGAAFGAVGYDGSVEGLTEVLARLAEDPGLAHRLAAEPPPPLGDPRNPYSATLPEVRHLRSQGGLATAALARLEAVRFPKVELSRSRKLLQAVIGMMPTSVVGLARKALPGTVKSRIRDVSRWDAHEERRRKQARWEAVRRRIADGDLDEVAAPRVSIVIPCFNQGDFVGDALLSVFEQTADDFEVVIVDDGSDDGRTPDILDSLSLARTTVIHQENVGLPGARNRGIKVARAEYVVMLDADDELAPTYLERMASALDSDEGSAFAHCWAELFGDFHAVWVTRPYNRYQLLLSNSVVGCVMVRKSAWEAVDGYDETMLAGNEDWDLWIRLMHAGFGAVEVRAPLFRYRKHGVSMSVETESRYESALTALSERLPHIYDAQAVSALKYSDYPLVTVITDAEAFHAPADDMQVVHAAYGEVGGVFPEVRGKYVVWWPAESTAHTGVILELCDVLEADDDLGAVETASDTPIRVVRTWSVRDDAAPVDVRSVDVLGSADRRFECGRFPDPEWSVPREIGGVAVERQRPEESGRIPDWMLS